MTITLDGTNGITTPDVEPTGSTVPTNGVYLPSANTVGIATNGTKRMEVDSSGRIGIGATPDVNHLVTIKESGTAQFALQNSSGTIKGWVGTIGAIGTAATDALRIRGDSGISMGSGGTQHLVVDTNGYLLVGYSSSNGAYKLQVNSQIFATSATIATSDQRYKENVAPVTNALSLVNSLNPVQFDWKQHQVHNFDTQTKQIGFLAQEVEQVLVGQAYAPAIIKTNTCTLPDGTQEEFKGIAEGNLVALLTAAIKELSTKNDALEARLAALEGASS